jgi:hypothetical protein
MMLDYLAYGAIGIAMATTVLTFRLLTSEQKKEIPNESILKMIKWFMGLTVFFSLFFGVIELIDIGGGAAPVTIENAAKYLSESDSSEYVLNSKPGSQEAVVYVNFGTDGSAQLGELTSNPEIDLNAKKVKDIGLWNIAMGSTVLGKVKLDVNEYRIIADSTNSKQFKVGEWYALDESDFWFRINSITGKSPDYTYNVSFGEGAEEKSIVPALRSLDYTKTPNGFIFLNQGFKLVRNDKWTRQYYVKFGAGLATNNSTSVQKLNVQVVGLNVD